MQESSITEIAGHEWTSQNSNLSTALIFKVKYLTWLFGSLGKLTYDGSLKTFLIVYYTNNFIAKVIRCNTYNIART